MAEKTTVIHTPDDTLAAAAALSAAAAKRAVEAGENEHRNGDKKRKKKSFMDMVEKDPKPFKGDMPKETKGSDKFLDSYFLWSGRPGGPTKGQHELTFSGANEFFDGKNVPEAERPAAAAALAKAFGANLSNDFQGQLVDEAAKRLSKDISGELKKAGLDKFADLASDVSTFIRLICYKKNNERDLSGFQISAATDLADATASGASVLQSLGDATRDRVDRTDATPADADAGYRFTEALGQAKANFGKK